MPRFSRLSRSDSFHDASIASISILDFLVPCILEHGLRAPLGTRQVKPTRRRLDASPGAGLEPAFCTVSSQASVCTAHQRDSLRQRLRCYSHDRQQKRYMSSRPRKALKENSSHAEEIGSHARSGSTREAPSKRITHKTVSHGRQSIFSLRGSNDERENEADISKQGDDSILNAFKGLVDTQEAGKPDNRIQEQPATVNHNERMAMAGSRLPVEFFTDLNSLKRTFFPWDDYQMTPWILKKAPRPRAERTPKSNHGKALSQFFSQRRLYHSTTTKENSKRKQFAEGSNLPHNFFEDILAMNSRTTLRRSNSEGFTKSNDMSALDEELDFLQRNTQDQSDLGHATPRPVSNVTEQMALLQSVRELEERLGKAKRELLTSMAKSDVKMKPGKPADLEPTRGPVVLTKEDYINLVDLYYYSYNSRFSPEATDSSPNPLVLEDYSFTLSSDFSVKPDQKDLLNENEDYESPLKHIEEMLKTSQIREVAAMQVFVDLLLDDYSSTRALFEAYKELPDPGVAYLPKGILRLFMQRMSTPWTISEKSMLRYLSLIDAMQKAQIPITSAEWSSAVYLAGRAFSRVTSAEVSNAFQIWQTMERDAGVKASNVTFNILFDIAVRAGRFALGETILKEMQSRNLRLNRLGRVSLIYYHGLRKDGDGIRKAYRDFVEAGEIVDTLVLNCVIASLLKAQEPEAAEQIYARMKNIQSQIRNGVAREEGSTLYERYPDPGMNMIAREMASNHLGRILQRAPHLQQIMPEHHRQLQESMPLTPNHFTFRALVAYHTTTSGDLDRLTVLLNDMTDFFHLPLQTSTFQQLFKGFAQHSPRGGPESAWSIRRLDLCWNACRAAIKASRSASRLDLVNAEEISNSVSHTDTDLPSITQVNATIPEPDPSPSSSRSAPRRLPSWAEFVLDLTSFSHEKLGQLRRFHTSTPEIGAADEAVEKSQSQTFRSPFFQSATLHAFDEATSDAVVEEDAYIFPNPSESGFVRRSGINADVDMDLTSGASETEYAPDAPHQVRASKKLVCWLLRAYARTTRSRLKVEEVWGAVRKIYKPRDAIDRDGVLKVLRRCLRDCDMERGP